MSNQSAQRLAAAPGPFAEYRTGTVVSFTTNQAVVSVGGTSFPAAYFKGTVLTAGALVGVLNQGGVWAILGVLAGVGDNLVINPSFELSASGTFPTDWFQANLSGTSSIGVQTDPTAPDGDQVAVVGGSAVGTQSYLYSQPIQVTSGEQFTLSAYVGGEYQPSDVQGADAALVALWFANSTNLYPTTSAVDTVVSTATDVVQVLPYTTLGGTVTAPVSGFMRVALRSTTQDSQQLKWDLVIARRV
ncbi:hypothetical protein L1085_009730 [Streptomyces sp. MSC1_001]|jgi:hypothetical protein|uniref:hypothetical protein n=1 Tax=Streptomyces sp. MSC1_001 TaxID=2909263 RepID=UPI00202F3888|nr:hypothetical protein [Streptomyces sp. MSC1_001]